MAITFKTAERRQSKLRLGISGPSGSGKTLGALKVARVLAGDWERVFVVDTERGSAALYSHLGPFLSYSMQPPFGPANFVEAIHAAEDAGASVIVIDSLSHAWAGAGGALEMVDDASQRSKGNKYVAWREVTPAHNELVDAMLQSPAHIIACLRAKQEYVQDKDENGRTQIKKVGLAPVQREGMEYEFTAFAELELNHLATATKDRTEVLTGRFQLNDDTGERLMAWINAEIKHEGGKTVVRQVETKEQVRARWSAFVRERGLTPTQIKEKLDFDKVSDWLAALPGRRLDDAIALFNGHTAPEAEPEGTPF